MQPFRAEGLHNATFGCPRRNLCYLQKRKSACRREAANTDRIKYRTLLRKAAGTAYVRPQIKNSFLLMLPASHCRHCGSFALCPSSSDLSEQGAGGGSIRALARLESPAPCALVTSRNNLHLPWWHSYDTPFREPKPYVQKCCKGTLALFLEAGRVVFTALPCGSWSCSSCRKVLAAQLLDRLRCGMESRAEHRRTLLTLTIDPKSFGAVPIGHAYWDRQRKPALPHESVKRTVLWSQPTVKQFAAAVESMSSDWHKLNNRLGKKCSSLDLPRFGYFRVVELHRNGWPHYHVVLEHPDLGPEDVNRQVAGWSLGITDAREISLDDAVGELAPYLCSAERKGNGSKAYQFAATALPKNFRLYSVSRDFLAAPAEPEVSPEHSFPVRGHFSTHHESARSWGADARIVLEPPQSDRPHKPPSSSLCLGDSATLYYLELLSQTSVHIPPE